MAKLICMSFDGEYQTERPVFETSDKAWEYSNDLGSKWFFYPFHFVVSNTGKTVIDAPYMLEALAGKRVKTVANLFKKTSERKDMENADCDRFAAAIYCFAH